MKSGIYQIINKKNNKFYIGSTANLQKRFNVHTHLLIQKRHHCNHLQNAVNKYGIESFEFKILIKCPNQKEYLLKLEQWFIDNYKPHYNSARIAGSRAGIKQSIETIKKVSEKLRGKKYPNRKRPHKFTEEHKINISKGLVGKVVTDITRQKLSLKAKERGILPETRLKNIEANKRPVSQFDKQGNFIKNWGSIKEAEQSLGIHNTSISAVCRGRKRHKMAGGYIWKYGIY